MKRKVLVHDQASVGVISLPISENKELYDWVKANMEPVYRDTVLKEHLYDIDIEEYCHNNDISITEMVSDYAKALLSYVDVFEKNAAYIRFIEH